ncbi:DMT family transporter [Canibacter zhoujuaniae]|uniref:DMT family transporter n=1 Tax=Canibacter zhoujuaniae TaxID=2708343 RepID=UPI001FB973B5|nr:DMT family transporter [Canibacter zhoujuaniae]
MESTLAFSGLQLLGIPIALAGAVLMSIGTQYQSIGLNKVERITRKSASSGLSGAHLGQLLRRPSWLFGTGALGLAVGLQMVALALSPLIVVQPLGVVALVVTAVLNAKFTGVVIPKRVRVAISFCVLGIFVFVATAAMTAHDVQVSEMQLIIILVIFAVVVASLVSAFIALRHRPNALLYIVGAGILYGFVATFAKTVISRIQQGEFGFLTWLALGALILGAVLGMIYVQNAHSSGPPDLVIAGLTVIDPIVAVLIGIIVLGEAQHAPIWAALIFSISGLIAMLGVFGIAKFHPQVGKDALQDD